METKKNPEIKIIADGGNATTSVINNAFNKWSEQWWFKILFCVVTFLTLALFIQFSVSKSINSTMDEREHIQKVEHSTNFEVSKKAYSDAKKVMTNYIEAINCDYMFLLEYHNGSENIVTGLQFCKFDMTLEISGENVEIIPLNKFKDDIIARYDILLSDEMEENKVIVKPIQVLKHEDAYLYYQLQSINAQKMALFNLKDKNSAIYASLLCVSVSNDIINETNVILCARELENILNSNDN